MHRYVSVQADDFDLAVEYHQLRAAQGGAIVTFTGLVRDYCDDAEVTGLTLEHYPGMTESVIDDLISETQQRWALLGCRVIHRIGYIAAHQQIVLVAVSAAHRGDAFNAANFIMDNLKTRVPLWKKQHSQSESAWVAANPKDTQALKRW